MPAITAADVGGGTFPSGIFSFTTPPAVFSYTTKEVIKSSSGTLSATEVSNTIINNYGQSAINTLTLPAAALGLCFTVIVSSTGTAIHVKAGAGDCIYLQSTKLDDADKVSLTTPLVGDSATFFAFQSGSGSYDWKCLIMDGLWFDGGV